jgi:hypothetical protein
MGTQTTKDYIDRTINEPCDTQCGEVFTNVGRSIAEDYTNARLDVHLHIRFSTEEYCAILNRDIEIISSGNSTTEGTRDSKHLTEGSPCEEQVSVLVRIVQDLKIPEIPPVVVWPRTITRLKRIDYGTHCVGHPSELPPFFSLILDGVFEDRELIPVVGDIPLGQNQLPDQMVKGAPKVVEHLSKEHFHAEWHRRYILEAADLLSRLVIDIAGNDIGIEVLDGQELSVQHLDMFTGPVILNARTVEGSHAKALREENSKDSKGLRDTDSYQGRRIQGSEKGGGAYREELRDSQPPGEGLTQPAVRAAGRRFNLPLSIRLAVHRHQKSLIARQK